jgi:glycerophosphoryl diester phosphodiesterase
MVAIHVMDTQFDRRSHRPLILAHRGACHAAPENTMAAFRLAADLGADGVELDVQLCSDGEAVVIHNFSVDETTNGSGQVKGFTLAELQSLDAGSWYATEFAGERIPILAQVLYELGPRLIINIELKTVTLFSHGLETEVVRLVEDSNTVHRVIISSFDPLALWRVRRLNRFISTGLLYAPDQPRFLRDRWLQPLVRPAALHPRWDMIDERAVAVAHRQGLKVIPWACDEPDDMRRLAGWEVDAIITSRPDLLYGLLHGPATAE